MMHSATSLCDSDTCHPAGVFRRLGSSLLSAVLGLAIGSTSCGCTQRTDDREPLSEDTQLPSAVTVTASDEFFAETDAPLDCSFEERHLRGDNQTTAQSEVAAEMLTTVAAESGTMVRLSTELDEWHFDLLDAPSLILPEGALPLAFTRTPDTCVEMTGQLPLEGSATIRQDVKVEARRCFDPETFEFRVVRSFEGGNLTRELRCSGSASTDDDVAE